FFCSSRRRHTRSKRDWSSDVCSSDLTHLEQIGVEGLLRLVDAEVREGVTELSCHPGYVEPGFRSSYLMERELELRTLCDPRVRRSEERRVGKDGRSRGGRCREEGRGR